MSETLNLPVLPMRNSVLLPGVSTPISAGRPATLRAIEAALKTSDRRVFAVAQRQDAEAVTPEMLHTIGTIATIGSVQRGLGSVRLLVEGRPAASRCASRPARKRFLEASVQEAREMLPHRLEGPGLPRPASRGARARRRARQEARPSRRGGRPDPRPRWMSPAGSRISSPATSTFRPPSARRCSRRSSVEDRLRRVLVHVQRQIDVLSAQEDIQEKVKEELGGRQREAYLREQLKAIQKELGEGEGAAATSRSRSSRRSSTRSSCPPRPARKSTASGRA